jgi:hypothetical protein
MLGQKEFIDSQKATPKSLRNPAERIEINKSPPEANINSPQNNRLMKKNNFYCDRSISLSDRV